MAAKKETRNRAETEKQLLKAVDEIVCEDGFEKLGINAVATKANVSKMLIYRYFGSLEGLISAYISKYDFWASYDFIPSKIKNVRAFVKDMFKNLIKSSRDNYTLRRLLQWEIASDNEFVAQLRQQREKNGLKIVKKVSAASGIPRSEIAAVATILSASITYLTILGETCEKYNGINIQKKSGWKRIEQCIDNLIDMYFKRMKIKRL